MAIATNLGFPRLGKDRQLKKALEAYWSGRSSADDLQQAASQLRTRHWHVQHDFGMDVLPVGDFSLYDHVLDTALLLGAFPPEYRHPDQLDTYFAMARGTPDASPLEMTKWFDTNYHYLVPELAPDQEFEACPEVLLSPWRESQKLRLPGRPVMLGPVSFLQLAKCGSEPFDRLSLLDRLLLAYTNVIEALSKEGATWIQIDEPCLILDLPETVLDAYRRAYEAIARNTPASAKLLLTTYFGSLGDSLPLVQQLPVAGIHLDLTTDDQQLASILSSWPQGRHMSLGVVDGRNVWRTDLRKALEMIQPVADKLDSDQIMVAPSCSLLHCPMDVRAETELDLEVKRGLAFAVQKLDEVALLTQALNGGESSIAADLQDSDAAMTALRQRPDRLLPKMRERLQACRHDLRREAPFAERYRLQQQRLELPLLPTTTIGSFPQTADLRLARRNHRLGLASDAEYDDLLRKEICHCIEFQDRLGLDVLVHGEAERNDMVEYFAESLSGIAVTRHGWVQSYGSRCVKPPIIWGDVERKQPLTVKWISFAQSLTERPVKGMLTGPVTLLNWSFVRTDQPLAETCQQLALAVREELRDLEEVGIAVIQVDEPALREGVPLKEADQPDYLRWAVDAFRLATSAAKAETQVHTHMCYAEFNDILPWIAELDADVLSIESARSRMEVLEAFAEQGYQNAVGPGVYDVHAPRTPAVQELVVLLNLAVESLSPSQIWVNPDCGLKTRKWKEVEPALKALVAAAKQLRETL